MTQVTHAYVLTRGGTEQLTWEGAGEDAQELLLLELLLKPPEGTTWQRKDLCCHHAQLLLMGKKRFLEGRTGSVGQQKAGSQQLHR